MPIHSKTQGQSSKLITLFLPLWVFLFLVLFFNDKKEEEEEKEEETRDSTLAYAIQHIYHCHRHRTKGPNPYLVNFILQIHVHLYEKYIHMGM